MRSALVTTLPAAPAEHSAGASVSQAMPETRFLERPEGRIAYTDRGSGQLVIMVPGLGDLKEQYRLLAPRLVAAGYRVVAMDIRGHGASSVTWSDYTCGTQGSDVLALIAALDAGPAILIGNSMAGGSVAWAAAEAPNAVTALVLIDPFARNVPMPAWKALLFKVLTATVFTGPWGPAAWAGYYTSLYPSSKPSDFDAYKTALIANLKEPGRMAALRATARTDRSDVEPRLASVHAPTLVVMGARDPDFDDPAGEAETIAKLLRGRTEMIEDAGHYPHAEMPEATAPVILDFLTAQAGR